MQINLGGQKYSLEKLAYSSFTAHFDNPTGAREIRIGSDQDSPSYKYNEIIDALTIAMHDQKETISHRELGELKELVKTITNLKDSRHGDTFGDKIYYIFRRWLPNLGREEKLQGLQKNVGELELKYSKHTSMTTQQVEDMVVLYTIQLTAISIKAPDAAKKMNEILSDFKKDLQKIPETVAKEYFNKISSKRFHQEKVSIGEILFWKDYFPSSEKLLTANYEQDSLPAVFLWVNEAEKVDLLNSLSLSNIKDALSKNDPLYGYEQDIDKLYAIYSRLNDQDRIRYFGNLIMEVRGSDISVQLRD